MQSNFLGLLLYALLGLEIASLRVSPSTQVPPPTFTGLAASASVPQPGLHNKPLPDDLRIEVASMTLDPNDREINFEIRIVNQSTHNVQLPISQDGKNAFETCREQEVDVSDISVDIAETTPRETAIFVSFYSCRQDRATAVTVKPQDWISVVGRMPIKLAPLNTLTAHISFSLGDESFSEDGPGKKARVRTRNYTTAITQVTR